MTAVTKLAEYSVHVSSEWSERECQMTRIAVQDTLACIIAGRNEPVTQKVASLPNQNLALVLGTAAHALDYDDNFDPALAHASAVLVPALLSAGKGHGKTVEDLSDAYLVGLQVMAHVGFALNPVHRFRGWHATSTIGPIGAAAGVARLLGLNAAKTANAISLSVSMAAGTTAQFGTEAKPLHAGLAAKAAQEAAQLASAGVQASDAALDGKFGFQNLYAGDAAMRADIRKMYPKLEAEGRPLEFILDDLDKDHVINRFPLLFKFFPNCGSAHAIAEAALLSQAQLQTADRIEIGIPTPLRENLRFDRPQTGAEAKFSASYVVALICAGRAPTLEAFQDAAVCDRDVAGWLDRITVNDTGMPKEADDGGTLTLHDGGVQTVVPARWSKVRGTEHSPAEEADAAAKLHECWAYARRGGIPPTVLHNLVGTTRLDSLITRLIPTPAQKVAAE